MSTITVSKNSQGVELLIGPDNTWIMDSASEVKFSPDQVRVKVVVNGVEEWLDISTLVNHATSRMEDVRARAVESEMKLDRPLPYSDLV